MKNIPNKSVNIESNPKAKTFADLLVQALDFMPPGGFDPATLRARSRVEKALEGVGAGHEIKLEDSDYETAQAAVKSVRWVGRHGDYIALADAFGV